MEIYSTTGHTNEAAISTLEKRIVALSSNSANPTSALLILLQSLANLKAGSTETMKYLVSYFSYPGTLDRIDLFDLVVKFVPSLAVKTKEYFKLNTNMSFGLATHILDEERPSPLDKDLQDSKQQ